MACRKAPPCPRNRPHPTRGAGHRWVKVCRGDHLSPAKHARAHEIPVMRKTGYRANPTEQTMEPSSHLVVTTAPSAERWRRRNTTSGQAGFVHYRHAPRRFHPGMMAPTTANASGHHSEGKQRYEQVEGSHHGRDVSQQAPTAIQRLSGRCKSATETAHCPDTSVVPSATKPTMMAPNGSCSNLNWMDLRMRPTKNRQRIDSKREQHPAEQAELDDLEKNADDDHGDCAPGQRLQGVAPSTTTMARSAG